MATLAEAGEIEALMKTSTREIFPRFYARHQTESSIKYVATVDCGLIVDGTYFVVEVEGRLVACGGWSRHSGSGEGDGNVLLDPATEPARVRAMFVHPEWTRRGLGTRILDACEAAAKARGFRSLDLIATLPGLPLYEHYGFRVTERVHLPLADGETITGARMRKAIG